MISFRFIHFLLNLLTFCLLLNDFPSKEKHFHSSNNFFLNPYFFFEVKNLGKVLFGRGKILMNISFITAYSTVFYANTLVHIQ